MNFNLSFDAKNKFEKKKNKIKKEIPKNGIWKFNAYY